MTDINYNLMLNELYRRKQEVQRWHGRYSAEAATLASIIELVQTAQSGDAATLRSQCTHIDDELYGKLMERWDLVGLGKTRRDPAGENEPSALQVDSDAAATFYEMYKADAEDPGPYSISSEAAAAHPLCVPRDAWLDYHQMEIGDAIDSIAASLQVANQHSESSEAHVFYDNVRDTVRYLLDVVDLLLDEC